MKFSILDYFPIYLSNDAEKHPQTVLLQITGTTSLFSINAEPCSSVENASAQGHRRLKELFTLFSISLFAKLHHGGPSSMKVVKKLLDAGEISSNIISMADEMYYQQQNEWYP